MSTETQSSAQVLTVSEAARYFNRKERTIRLWCVDGTLLAANCKVIRQKPGNWAIVIPAS